MAAVVSLPVVVDAVDDEEPTVPVGPVPLDSPDAPAPDDPADPLPAADALPAPLEFALPVVLVPPPVEAPDADVPVPSSTVCFRTNTTD